VDQIGHIFRKDLRRHWREIVLSLAILVAFAWNEPSQWMPRRLAEHPLRAIFSGWLTAMVLISWWLLIVRVVHEEVLAGDRQFWVTRPYEWKKLLAAKALFLVVFVNLPLFIVQMVLLSKAGFTPSGYPAGLLYLQLLWVLTLILPLTTLATVTSSFGQAVLVTLGILLGMIGLAALSSVDAIRWLTIAKWSPVWLPSAIKTSAYAVVVFVLVWQYARRRTQQSRLLLVAAAAAVLVVPSPPDSFPASEYPQPSAGQPPIVQFAFDSVRPKMEGTLPEKNKVSVRIPLLVSGIEPSSAVNIDGTMVEIEAPGGLLWNSGWFKSSDFLLQARSFTDLRFSVDSAFFEQVKSSSARVHISFALAAFEAKETRRIPAADGEFAVPGRAFCAIDQDGSSALQCRSPLRRPFLVVSTIAGETTCPPGEDEKAVPPGTVFSAVNRNWEAAPAELGISPVKVFSLDLFRWSRTRDDSHARLCSGTPLAFNIPEEVNHTRVELNIDSLRLADYQLHKISLRGGSAIGIGAVMH
jgi:hypothetical protein